MPDTSPLLTLDFFAARVGQQFQADVSGQTFPLTLIEAAASHLPSPRGQGFALEFQGPTTPLLPQQTYSLHHAGTGTLDIFLVPIRRDVTGVVYEAVFN